MMQAAQEPSALFMAKFPASKKGSAQSRHLRTLQLQPQIHSQD